MYKKLSLTLVTVFAFTVFAVPVSAQSADHCPDKDNPNKVESASGSQTVNGVNVVWGGDPGSLTLTNTNTTEATVMWCAKGGKDFYQNSKTTGEQTTVLDASEANAFNFGTEISYLIVYKVTVEEPEQPERPEEPETPEVPEAPETPGGALQELEAPTEAPQAQAPEAGVAAGGSTGIIASIVALSGSVTALGYGLLRLRNFGA